jgi:formylglycine-generating enzyme required for sulfatase activity
MKMRSNVFLSLIISLILTGIGPSCDKRPSAPDYDNPLDPENPATKGEPFSLTAAISNGGITLNWTKASHPEVVKYNIYRSEQAATGYSRIFTTNDANQQSYTDATVANGHTYWYQISAVNKKNQESARTNTTTVEIHTQPVISINGNAQFTITRQVSLTLLANNAVKMMLANNSDFSGVVWENYSTVKNWSLTIGEGQKTVYFKVKYEDNSESSASNATINPQPINPGIIINTNEAYTSARNVSLSLTASGSNLQMKLSENADFTGSGWESFISSKSFELSTGDGEKTVYAKFKNDFEIETTVSDKILPLSVQNQQIKIGESDTTNTLNVQLNITAQNALKMMISNDPQFTDGIWENFIPIKSWQLDYSRALNFDAVVYAKFKNDFEGVSSVVQDNIYLKIKSGISINNNETYASSRSVTLYIFSENANSMMFSNYADFSNAQWENYTETKNWTLLTGSGPITVFAKFKNSSGLISDTYADSILPLPINPLISINTGDEFTSVRLVMLNLIASGNNIQMEVSENADFTGSSWETYSASKTFELSTGDGEKTVYAKFKNDFDIESTVVNDPILLDTTPPHIAANVSPESGVTNETDFTFDVSGCSDNLTPFNQLLLRYDFNNDGNYETGWEFAVQKAYTYPTGGDKTIKIELKDGAGWMVSQALQVSVNTRPVAVFTAAADPPFSLFWHFDATASYDAEDGENIEYRWDFDGDSGWDTGWLVQDTISYTFADYGEYNSKLQTRDLKGLSNEEAVAVAVAEMVEMVYVAGGTFTMGDTWGDGYSNELPTHMVTVSSFNMSKYEVTQEQYEEVMGNNPSFFKGDSKLPVEGINWYDAVTFCNTLSTRAGLTPCYTINGLSTTCSFNANGYRLPTEAEWEYAARGGPNDTNSGKYSGSDSPDGVAWYSSNSGNQTHPVGQKQPNELGLYDMSGNVWEWCYDWYYNSYYSISPPVNPTGPEEIGLTRINRGGDWGMPAKVVRVAVRGCNDPLTQNYIGLRLLRAD